jgi:hypothetical protein
VMEHRDGIYSPEARSSRRYSEDELRVIVTLYNFVSKAVASPFVCECWARVAKHKIALFHKLIRCCRSFHKVESHLHRGSKCTLESIKGINGTSS